ncbi:hypothetical protein HYH02_006501 [Chlamydomonas schloesseri]|uniref:CN hydrolase domain-containing protein n=1 Tax=Chlamydomonas schloesseri TaxID=2026947 RepID=A0A836B603_9CHLO|nr:hypothetical protein HYH02_006501 [Chlamydomonas schloesseri]|eukprot:KAG2448612.1 hypothetical protein HYH02_006501 [Chlamydomonas schloesseri]
MQRLLPAALRPKRATDMAPAPPERRVVLAVTQFAMSEDREANVAKAEQYVRRAAAAGANIILLPELFESPYFAQVHSQEYFQLAAPYEGHPLVERFAALAGELGVVLTVPFFEAANNAYFNSCAMVDADGAVLGRYRKSHIPDGPGFRYLEKYYMSPGDTGLNVYDTAYGRVGLAICWDQWFPEAARALVLQGAEVLLYPSCIGDEPHDPATDSYPHWMRVQQGHAAANMVPLLAANRVGREALEGATSAVTYYGGSFIAGAQGQVLAQVGASPKALAHGDRDPAPDLNEGFVTAAVDLAELAAARAGWGIFRDRRPDLYGALLTKDGGSGGSVGAGGGSGTCGGYGWKGKGKAGGSGSAGGGSCSCCGKEGCSCNLH